MSKVRINDLARELEVKSRPILDALEAIGVTGKTHSSSIEADQAERVREYFKNGGKSSTASKQPADNRPKFDLSKVSKPGDALKAIMERYQLDDSVDPAADSTTKVARPAQAATPVTDDSPATGRTLERRRTTRPWTAGGAARATVAKTAPPGPRFAKVADDDTDWKEF